jgi:hypothetical protein
MTAADSELVWVLSTMDKVRRALKRPDHPIAP